MSKPRDFESEMYASNRALHAAWKERDELAAQLSAVREENARLREALEEIGGDADSHENLCRHTIQPERTCNCSAGMARRALSAPTPEKGARWCKAAEHGSHCPDWCRGAPSRATTEHPEREDSTPNTPKVPERETKVEEE